MNTKEIKSVSTAQIRKIHVLLNQKGLIGQKETMVNSVSRGRTQSTKELTFDEARELIIFLSEKGDESENKRKIFKAVWKLDRKMGIIYGNTDEDYQMNRAKLNMFCRQRGSVKKNIPEMNLIELRKIHRQFEAMYKKYEAKNIEKTKEK